MTGHVRKSPCKSEATPNIKRKTANNISNSVRKNQSAGNSKTFPKERGDANVQPHAMVIHINLNSCHFVMDPYLIELICGSDTNKILNLFFVCLYPNTPNFTSHRYSHRYYPSLDLKYFVFRSNDKCTTIIYWNIDINFVVFKKQIKKYIKKLV